MLTYEKEYSQYKLIAGIDEAGRGPLASVVATACVIMPLDEEKIIDGINDSKKLTEKKREMLYEKIISTALAYRIELVDEKIIDEINILQATKLGCSNCIKNLGMEPDIILTDALDGLNTEIKCVSIIKGDGKSYNIAAASILAKVTRDRLMVELDKIYPQYGFAKHKGYGTKAHIDALKEFGACEIHRRSFIKNFVGEGNLR